MSNLTVATWNVNSINVRLGGVCAWLSAHRPEVLCLQETKVPDERFPVAAFEALGYAVAFAGQKAYNGVAIVSRKPITAVHRGLPGDEAEAPRRLIAATVEGTQIINVYVPNGSEVGSEKFAYKLLWLERLRQYLHADFDPKEAVLLCGDFNIAPEERDVWDPKAVAGKVLFHPDEHAALERIRTWGFIDAFRLHSLEAGQFSWWDYRAAAFRRNLGMRIDHIWVSGPLAERCSACWIDAQPRAQPSPSDHVPVAASFC
ncbi:exodeoxyribonuclease III [Gloeobacter morelensis]|uniref:Exodeoxyribonuclease III n=1 Tax=Gloeobacter morelensis MG652769 TaxID=2781736 RepID=A0ABY3PG08_9CYAN|nr:exodeoxyribonuclease III [Gloeobacter morelensis]UFP92582.1 exodeoxyribonuclease III [Gloeobacter morelensis MG652769]